MCDYTCIVHNNGNPNRDHEIEKQYLFHDDYVTFISNELSSVHQKVMSYNNEDIFLVYDGEIYNKDELYYQLAKENSELIVETDGELIKELFMKHKENLFQYLRGKFSIIIWDKNTQTLYGARDQFGIKSLFYEETDDSIILSTQKKDIIFITDNTDLSHDSLHHYLSFQFVPDPNTMTSGIHKVEPGHYFIKKIDHDIDFTQYWRANFNPILMDKQYWITRIREILYDSVQAHIRDVDDIGAFLSGGIDSTIITAMAKEYFPNLKTFSVGFDREGFSEIDIAKETADQLGVENISYIVSPEEYVEKLPEIIWHMDDPLADPSCVPLYFVAREARKHTSTVLSGEGADELFGGYNIYREPESLKIFDSIPSPAKHLLAKLADALPEGVKGKSFLQRGTTPLRERYIGNAKMFEEDEKASLLKEYNENLSYHDITHKLFDHVTEYPLVNQMQYIDINTWLRGDILLKAQRMSKANHLDVRMPFLDKEVFHIASEIPVDLKIANGTTKSILREAVRGIIPDHVLDRKKLGFPVPIRHWLKNELNGWAKQLIKESETDYLLHKSEVLRLLENHNQDMGDYSRKIWTVLMFMLWHQIFVEKKYDFADQDKHYITE